ncbi:MAG TPA: amino acid permease [Gemmatimonadaceae bacterium]|nr:amino acid permease [Gemmatimonadaceae bacterium]
MSVAESPPAAAPVATSPAYARRIGLFSGTMMVIGGIVGSGIFLNPAIVAQRVGTAPLTMAAWALGALVALLGAFIFAELGARHPSAGGGYVYLRDAFGRLPAFLYGWALLLAIATGAMAAVAVTFASYAAPLLGLPPGGQTPLAIGAIALLTLVNVLGVRPGTITQNVFTILKLVAIAVLIVAGLTRPALPEATACAAGLACAELVAPSGVMGLALALGTALVPVLFAYGGWQQTNFVAEEMVTPERNLPRALVVGVLVVGVVYLGVNLTYLQTLGVAGLAASRAPAADAMAMHFGPAGRALIAAGIAISTFGFLNLVILVTPRVYQAMARDGLFFRRFAELHPRFRTPVAAIVVQGAWAIALVLSGTYGQLLDYVTFADWIFFGATACTLVVYRRRDGAHARAGYRAPLYPVSVALFVLAAVYVVAGAVVSNPVNAVRGTVLLAAGVPVYAYWRRRASSGG